MRSLIMSRTLLLSKYCANFTYGTVKSLFSYKSRKIDILKYQSKRWYRFTPTMAMSNDYITNDPLEPFRPKRALVLAKFSRYEFEKRRNKDLDENELIRSLNRRGSDYNMLLKHHNVHVKSRDSVAGALQRRGIETRVVNRFDYTDENINWADVIVTSGGDGTFLMAASKVNNRDKPLIGVNSDPTRSVGYLCLPKRYSNNFDSALQMLDDGQFKWKYRQRIRVTLEAENAFDDPIELHDQQLLHPEYRFLELEPPKAEGSTDVNSKSLRKRILPFRSLNEVFVGESLSSRVSYYEFAINGGQKVKLKSSGLTICSGTGSTSWSFNINKVTPQCVQSLFKIVNEEMGQNLPFNDVQLIQKLTDRFNSSLLFDPSKLIMAYTIRDPVVFGIDFNSKPRGFANKIEVKSRMFDASIVIDGGLSYKFNDGANATFEILEDDALRTVSLKE